MATYAIGDIQGCYQSFRKLLNKISFNTNCDRLLLAGDLINRGPKSLETMDFILSNQTSIQAVLGNHDLHFLAIANQCQSIKAKDTINDILGSDLCEPITSWLSHCPLSYYDEAFDSLLVHAGLPFFWSKQDAIIYSAEISAILTSEHAMSFYKAMYGNQPSHWDQNLTGNDRYRFITNAFTRMRYCYLDGGLELTIKSPPTSSQLDHQQQALLPWFNFSSTQFNGKILFGHWAALQGKSHNDRMIPLDTGCVWGGKLTAYRLDDQQYFRVNAID